MEWNGMQMMDEQLNDSRKRVAWVRMRGREGRGRGKPKSKSEMVTMRDEERSGCTKTPWEGEKTTAVGRVSKNARKMGTKRNELRTTHHNHNHRPTANPIHGHTPPPTAAAVRGSAFTLAPKRCRTRSGWRRWP